MGRIRLTLPRNRLVERLKCWLSNDLHHNGGVARTMNGRDRPLSRPYLYGTVAAAVLCLGLGVAASPHPDTFPFLLLLVLALVASPLKVALPGAFSTLSVNYIFILAAVSELSLMPALLVTAAATVCQSLWGCRGQARTLRIAFDASTAIVAASAAHAAAHASWAAADEGAIPLLFASASLAWFVVSTGISLGMSAVTEGLPERRIWMTAVVRTAPPYLVGATIAALFRLMSDHVGWQWAILVLPSVYAIYVSYRLYTARIEAERRHATEISELHLRTLEALAVAIEAKDETTHDHLRRVQVYATEIARDLQVSEAEIEAIRAAALLHDIGKLAVPEYILSKPGRLTPDEFERIKVHPVVGAEILERVRFPYPVVPIVAAHHEKWDGSGYPAGLRGEQIPIGARILTAVDCLDALASERQYRRALPLDEAMKTIAGQAGSSFDPRVIEVLKRRYRELESLAREAPLPDAKLSLHVAVDRGDAPDAGYVNIASRMPPEAPSFINFIAAARQEFQNLHELTNSLGTSLSLEATLSLLAAHLKNIAPHDTIAVYISDGQILVPQYVAGVDADLFASMRVPVGHGLSGWVAENRKAIVNGNPAVEPGCAGEGRRSTVLASAISVPLTGTDGVIGVLTLYHRSKDAFTRDHQRLLTAISSKASLTIENALRFLEAREGTMTDALTGLANTRALFMHLEAEIARAGRGGESLTVLVLDLDGFKEVNDRFGHLVGNKLLRQVARYLQSTCRGYDCVARMGGDEFALVLAGMTQPALAHKRDELIRLVRNAAVECTGEKMLSVSIGESWYPAEGTSAEDLLAEADRKMYAMKHARRNRGRAVPVLGDTKIMAMGPVASTRLG
ncbi:MAG TPA: HD domain-containing phosphohydrolase [Bryobacteraceae bacterium]|nr:HD domain-containing phosphohydrolase [Bryobacteraceae bacterium]